MTRLALSLAAFLVSVFVGFHVAIAYNPPDPAQRNSDVYEIAGWPSPKLQTLNPLTMKLKSGSRSVTYSYVVVKGCSDGNMRNTLNAALASTSQVTGISFTQVSSGADVSVRATCGVDAVNAGISGGVIADLYPSWPYQSTINASTTMASFYDLSQVSIWLHEFAGHGMGTWNEQYLLDGTFGATPGLVDFMSTGPNSRFDWPKNDVDRWERTMYSLTADVPEWGACEPYGGCFNNRLQLWVWQIDSTVWLYDPANHIGPQFTPYGGWFCSAGCPGR